jgi:hypothetical protein
MAVMEKHNTATIDRICSTSVENDAPERRAILNMPTVNNRIPTSAVAV